MKRRVFILLSAFSSFCAFAFGANEAEKRTAEVAPAIFGEGIISTGDYDSHPAFTPDGQTLYFVKSNPTFDFWTIVVSHLEGGKWSSPEVAPFSGRYADADPFITADGAHFYFISNRPIPGKTAPDLDIWMMDKTAEGWSEPRNPGAPINSNRNEWYPNVTNDGTIYFGSEREGGKGGSDIYRAQLAEGRYLTAENLGDAINTKYGEFEPCVSPDERYLIFAAASRPDGKGQFDLFISYRHENNWTKAVNLSVLNTEATEFSPRLSPHGTQFFFASTRGIFDKPFDKRMDYEELTQRMRAPRNGLGDIYQIPLNALKLEMMRGK